MPPAKNPIWEHFLPGAKQNSSHIRAHCIGCVQKKRPTDVSVEFGDNGNEEVILTSDEWVIEALKSDVGGVLGVKDAMAAHILGKSGTGRCPNASSKARQTARTIRDASSKSGTSGKRQRDTSSESESGHESDGDGKGKRTRRKLVNKVKQSMKQSELKVFRGLNIPFTESQMRTVQQQVLRGTISANLPFQWIEDPEILRLFLLFRSTAGDVLPSRKQIAGPLLDAEDARVLETVKSQVKGEYAVISTDGWKDVSRDSVNGVSLSVKGKSHLIELIHATAHQKDGAAMCKAFEDMIDRAEEVYNVWIVAFCCDNDGGSQRGRKDLVLKRPWLFGPPCCAHQFQLILGEYFKVNAEAAATAEEATDLIGWMLNHQRVRSIFNEVQAEISGKVLSILVANLTRWTTHLIAFQRLLKLKDAFRRAVISKQGDIIEAQVGAEKNRQKRQKLETDATVHCELIDNPDFWRRLKAVCDDLEPICLALNKNQSDSMRPDQAALSFAAVFLYFQTHSDRKVATEMTKRIEKRWNALDQSMFLLAIVLNPYECLSRFGDQASVDPFTLNNLLLETYRRVCSRPFSNVPNGEEPDEAQLLKEKAVSEAFLSYLSLKGVFAEWETNLEAFQRVHGDNPIAVWEAFSSTTALAELADFAILLLGMSVNQAALERNFSDLKIKKSCIRNRIRLPRLEKMAKVGADIRASHAEAGFLEKRTKRKNHDSEKVAELLVVPRYAEHDGAGEDGLQTEDGSRSASTLLVRSRRGWRQEMARWVRDEQEKDSDDEQELTATTSGRPRKSKFLPRSLALLFGGRKDEDIVQQMERIRRREAHTEQARLMELIVDEAEGEEIPDNGELEGSGDDFDG